MKSGFVFIVVSILMPLFSMVYGQADLPISNTCVKAEVEEKIILHTDRNLYLTDETVYFKAHCLTDQTLSSPLSTVLYLELYNQQKQVLVQKKYTLQEGVAMGSFTIPEEATTDYYYLRAYTRYLRNFPPDDYANKMLKIINPTTEGKSMIINEETTISTTTNNTTPAQPLKLNIRPNKKNYKHREKVILNYEIPNELTEISIAVRPTTAGQRVGEELYFTSPTSPSSAPELEFLPEIYGLGITGIVRDASTKVPFANVPCLLSVVGEDTQIHVTETDAEGQFLFHLQHLQEEQTLYVGATKKTESTELLILNDFSPTFPTIVPQAMTFDSLQHQWIEDLFLNRQLQKNFPAENVEAVYQVMSSLDSFNNIGTPDISIETDVFIDLPALEDIFRDIVPPVSIKGKEGNRMLTVYNPVTNQAYDDPLILLDNIPVLDIESLLKINPAKVKRIDVIQSTYIVGDYLFGGIISIKTNTDNFAGYEWTNKSAFIDYKTLNKGDVFKKVTYDDASLKNKRSPDFRTTLYWNPQLSLDQTQVDFFTSDYSTEYEAVIRGFTKDGRYGEGRTVFVVDRK